MLVTFDFDDTLTQPVWDTEHSLWETTLDPRHTVMEEMKALHREGHDVRIVTSRRADRGADVDGLVDLYDLPVSNVVYTDGAPKSDTLVEMGVDCHFDDGLYVADECVRKGVRCIVVPHPLTIRKYRSRLREHEVFSPPTTI